MSGGIPSSDASSAAPCIFVLLRPELRQLRLDLFLLVLALCLQRRTYSQADPVTWVQAAWFLLLCPILILWREYNSLDVILWPPVVGSCGVHWRPRTVCLTCHNEEIRISVRKSLYFAKMEPLPCFGYPVAYATGDAAACRCFSPMETLRRATASVPPAARRACAVSSSRHNCPPKLWLAPPGGGRQEKE
jgi:hypothetical protein